MRKSCLMIRAYIKKIIARLVTESIQDSDEIKRLWAGLADVSLRQQSVLSGIDDVNRKLTRISNSLDNRRKL